jgi:hypothetical protein
MFRNRDYKAHNRQRMRIPFPKPMSFPRNIDLPKDWSIMAEEKELSWYFEKK